MIGRILTFVRFSHTIFALPFALGAMFVAADGWPGWRIFGLIVAAMVCARTAAMAFNRVADWEIDKRNPRTAGRHKLVPYSVGVGLCVLSAAAFLDVTWHINLLCFELSPVALLLVFGYSLTKRFTALCHFVLGLALSVSPVGAWLAVRGSFAIPPLILAGAVVLWVAGFDLIYATQDYQFDRNEGLHNLVVRLGIEKSLQVAQGLHTLMLFALAGFGYAAHLGIYFWAGFALIIPALLYEHRVAKGRDLDSINRAFFQSNAFVSLVFVLMCAVDVLI